MPTIEDFVTAAERDRALPWLLDAIPKPDDTDDEPAGDGAGLPLLPAPLVAAKRNAEAAAVERQKRRLAALRPAAAANDNAPRRPRNKGSHPDLAWAVSALGWWRATQNWPEPAAIMPAADNDNERPMSVPDRNPAPKMTGDELCGFLPAEVLAAMKVDGKLPADPRKLTEDVDFIDGRIARLGGLKFSTASGEATEFIRVNGTLTARQHPVDAGTLVATSKDDEPGRPDTRWHRIRPDAGRNRPEEGADAVARAAASVGWFARLLGARRATREAPPRDVMQLPKGLPYAPAPSALFMGMHVGKKVGDTGGGRGIRGPAASFYGPEDYVADRQAEATFRAQNPTAAKILDAAMTARTMAALVPANDNRAGKRALLEAVTVLANFLAA